MAVGDFNGDAKPDLAVISSGSISYDPGSVSVFLGNGDGTFQAPEGFGTNSRRAGAVAVGDFNGDGKLDLAVTTPAGVSVLMQTYSFSGFFQPDDAGVTSDSVRYLRATRGHRANRIRGRHHGLAYDPPTAEYTYVWKTDKA